MKRIYLLSLFFSVSTILGTVLAQNVINACNGKQYRVGDILTLGKIYNSSYLNVLEINKFGGFDGIFDRNLEGKKITIINIPPYNQELYTSVGYYDKTEEMRVAIAKYESRLFAIYLDGALASGSIISICNSNPVPDFLDLTSARLYELNCSCYNKDLTDSIVDNYAKIIDRRAYQIALDDPFAIVELRAEYRKRLHLAIQNLKKDQIYRVRATADVKSYDIEKQEFTIDHLRFIDLPFSGQNGKLIKNGMLFWGINAFRLLDIDKYHSVPSCVENAKSYYGIRKYQRESRVVTRDEMYMFIYIQKSNLAAPLPSFKVWNQMNKLIDFSDEYQKRFIDFKILSIDVYSTPFFNPINIDYNYVGTVR